MSNALLRLYGDSPLAMRAMEQLVLETYRREVLRRSSIDLEKHKGFLRDYGPALEQLPEIQSRLDSIGHVSRLLADTDARHTL